MHLFMLNAGKPGEPASSTCLSKQTLVTRADRTLFSAFLRRAASSDCAISRYRDRQQGLSLRHAETSALKPKSLVEIRLQNQAECGLRRGRRYLARRTTGTSGTSISRSAARPPPSFYWKEPAARVASSVRSVRSVRSMLVEVNYQLPQVRRDCERAVPGSHLSGCTLLMSRASVAEEQAEVPRHHVGCECCHIHHLSCLRHHLCGKPSDHVVLLPICSANLH